MCAVRCTPVSLYQHVSPFCFAEQIGQFHCEKNIPARLNLAPEKGILQFALAAPDFMQEIGCHCQLQVRFARSRPKEYLQGRLAAI